LTQIRYEKNTLVLPGREKIKLAERNVLPIFFFGRTADFQHIPFSDFYEKDKALPSFKNKIVIIGNDAPMFHDIYSTPLGELPGMTIAANEVLTLLERKIISPLDTFSNILIWLAAAALSMWAAYRFSVYLACGLIGVLIALFYVVSFLLFRQCVWIDFFTPVLVMVLSFLAVFFTRYLSLILEGARIKKLAVTDNLTGLLTFRYFRFVLEAKFEEAKKERKDLSLAEFDIDFLRTINDTQGREFGDQLLKKFSEILKDKAQDATIARYGGEEFIVLFEDASAQETLKWTQSILEHVRKNPLISKELTLSWSVSAGVTSRKSSKAEKASRLIQFADAALVKAKRLGRDQAVLFDATATFEDLQLVEEMQSQQNVPDTELGYLALDLEERNKELKDMADQLRKAFDEKVKTEKLAVAGELTARFSHEIKNPLANLKSCVEYLLAKPSKDAEAADFLKMISQEVSRMTKLSLQMLRFFKPQEEGMVSCSVNALIQDIYDISKRKFEGENVEVELSLDDNIPDVRVAPDQMKQVFLNLMMNALDAMRGNPGKLKIITSQVDPARVQIRFEDTGTGISEENKKKLFQSFFTTKKDGIGLGLSISYNIVKRHQGILEVDPAYQNGAAFVIMIPCIMPNI
jgi:diguanylate cyclase (GGDEF)-like protein